MNCPAKTEPILPDGHNQNPDELCSALTTRSDLGRLANARLQREHRLSDLDGVNDADIIAQPLSPDVCERSEQGTGDGAVSEKEQEQEKTESNSTREGHTAANTNEGRQRSEAKRWFSEPLRVLRTYIKFIGPGFMVAVVRLNFQEVNPFR